MKWPWEELGLDGPAALGEVRRAYARRLRTVRPETDPEAFQRLHSAYRTACAMIRAARAEGKPAENPDGVDPADRSGKPAGPDPSHPPDLSDAPESPDTEPHPDSARRASSGGTNPAEKDWDFVRLLAEGDAEERGRAFLRALELRKRHPLRWRLWERRLKRTPEDVGRAWVASSIALQTIDLLYTMGAGMDVWRSFLEGGAFAVLSDNPDFVFGLEDFLRKKPDLSPEVRRLMRQTLCRKALRWERLPLLRLLEDPQGRRRRRWILAAAVAVSILAAAAACLLGLWQERRQTRVLEWLEADFRQDFQVVRLWGRGDRFAPASDPDRVFRASLYGKRDPESGQRGYRSDYTNRLIEERLRHFADRWGYGWTWRHVGGLAGILRRFQREFYMNLPLTGAEAGLRALGAEIGAVTAEDWYQTLPPDYTLYLCWDHWCFYRYADEDSAFATAEAVDFYRERFGPELCRILLEESGIADQDMGRGSYELRPEAGTIPLNGIPFFCITGEDPETHAARMRYYLSTDGASLFAVPAARDALPLTAQDLYAGEQEAVRVRGLAVTLYRLSVPEGGT